MSGGFIPHVTTRFLTDLTEFKHGVASAKGAVATYKAEVERNNASMAASQAKVDAALKAQQESTLKVASAMRAVEAETNRNEVAMSRLSLAEERYLAVSNSAKASALEMQAATHSLLSAEIGAANAKLALLEKTAAAEKAVAGEAAASERVQREQIAMTTAALERKNAMVTAGGAAYTKMAGIGRNVFTGLAVVAGVAGYASIKAGTDFEATTLKFKTQAGASAEQVKELRKQILQLSPDVATGPNQLAEAMYHVVSVGKLADTQYNTLKAAALGAKLGTADLTATTNTLVGVMKSGVDGTESAAHTFAKLDGIIGAGNMTMEQFNAAMRSGIMDAANTFHVSLTSVGSALAYMTDRGVPAAQAATRLRMSLTLLGAPSQIAQKQLKAIGIPLEEIPHRTKAMSEALQKAGVTVFQLSAELHKPNGLAAALTLIKSRMTSAGLTADQQAAIISRAFGGGRSGAAIMSMYNNIDDLDRKYKQVTNTAGRFAENVKETQETAKYKFDQVRAAVQKYATEIGTNLKDKAVALIGSLVDLYHWLDKHHDVAIALAVAIGGPLTLALTAFAIDTAIALAPWLALGAAFGLVGYAIVKLYKHSETFRNIVHGAMHGAVAAFHSLQTNGPPILHAIGHALSVMWSIARPILSMLAHFVKDVLVAAFQRIGRTAKMVWHDIGKAFSDFMNGPGKRIKEAIDQISQDWNAKHSLLKRIVQGVWSIIHTIIKVYLDLVLGRIKVALDVIETVFKIAWHVVYGVVKFALDLIGNWIALMFRFYVNLFHVFGDIIHGNWSKLWKDLGKLAHDLLTDVGHLIWDACKDFGSLLYNVGKDIIQGLINGIKDMGGAVGGAIKDVAKGAVDSAKHFLGISSPSKVFHGLGVNINEGWANGIKASSPAAIKAMTEHTANMHKVAAKAMKMGDLGHMAKITVDAHHKSNIHSSRASHYKHEEAVRLDVTLEVDGKKLAQINQKYTLRKADVNGDNGLVKKRG